MNKTYATIPGVKPMRERDSDPTPPRVVPFGLPGAGWLTGHPVGLVVVVWAVCLAAWRLSEARWFLLFSVPPGVLIGIVLWFRNHRRTFASPPSIKQIPS